MKNILIIVELVLAALLMGLILIQNKDGGLSAAMGGGGSSFESTRRGPEKVIFNLTVIVAVLFVLNALVINLI